MKRNTALATVFLVALVFVFLAPVFSYNYCPAGTKCFYAPAAVSVSYYLSGLGAYLNDGHYCLATPGIPPYAGLCT